MKICPSLLPSTKDQRNLSDSEGGIKKITVDEQDGKKNKQTQRAETLGWWLAFCGVGSSDLRSCAVEAIRQTGRYLPMYRLQAVHVCLQAVE